MAEREQNYQNHVRWLPPFHFFVLPVLLLYVLNAVWRLAQDQTLGAAVALVVAVALLMLALMARVMAVTVQNRVIRLEMRLRLKQVLPAELQARATGLTLEQLVALRFAGDDELPALVRDVLDGKLSSQQAIKQAIKHWQADWLRA